MCLDGVRARFGHRDAQIFETIVVDAIDRSCNCSNNRADDANERGLSGNLQANELARSVQRRHDAVWTTEREPSALLSKVLAGVYAIDR